jgi:hypothetical protein
LLRQTGGAWCVVSLHAKFDADGVLAHVSLLHLLAKMERHSVPARSQLIEKYRSLTGSMI